MYFKVYLKNGNAFNRWQSQQTIIFSVLIKFYMRSLKLICWEQTCKNFFEKWVGRQAYIEPDLREPTTHVDSCHDPPKHFTCWRYVVPQQPEGKSGLITSINDRMNLYTREQIVITNTTTTVPLTGKFPWSVIETSGSSHAQPFKWHP